MASLPVTRKFNPGDYKSLPDAFTNRFISALNLFTDPVYVALQNGITFQENFNAQIFSFAITGGATAASNAVNFRQLITGFPVGLIKLSCNVSSDPSIPVTSPVDFSWYASGGQVYITAISGLTTGTQYILKVMLF